MTRTMFIRLAALLTVGACSGNIGGGEPGDVDPGAKGPTPSPAPGSMRPAPTGTGGAPGAVPPPASDLPPSTFGGGDLALRRLTTAQIANVFSDLFAYPEQNVAALPEVGRGAGFVDAGFLQSYLMVVEDVAASVGASGAPGFGQCAAGAATEAAACLRTQIAAIGEKLFRRPLAAEEVAGYLAQHDALAASGRPRAVATVVASLLHSPAFLYSFESATPDRPRLTPHEVAARLSFSLWNSVPDDELLAAARAGKLSSPDAVASQAARMIASPKARRMVANFFGELFPYEQAGAANRDAKAFPGTSADLFGDMVAETRTFLDQTVWQGEGTLADLFSAPHSYLNARLMTYYGLKPPAGTSNTVFVKTGLPAERTGILTQGSLLTALSHPNEAAPILRGVFVLKNLLCTALPQPPPDVAVPDPPSTKMSQRARFAKHSTDASCRACHQSIDPAGFGLETFDAAGKLVGAENGFPVTGQGQVTLDGKPVAFTGGAELGRLVAKSPQVRRCLVRQMFEYMTGMHETAALARTLDDLDRQFQAEGAKVASLPLAIVNSPAFLTPRAGAGGRP